MVWQWSRGPQLFIFIFIFFGLVRLDNPFPFSCSGWPARHLDEAFPFGVSQTRSSLRAFYPPTQLDTTQRDHAGSLAFPSGIELFEKKPQWQRRTSPIMHFHKLYRFFLFPVAGFFLNSKPSRSSAHCISAMAIIGIPYLGFLKTKQLAYIVTTKHILGYEIVKIEADTSLKCSQLQFFSQNV